MASMNQMVVLETREISGTDSMSRYVTAVTRTVIKAVDAKGYPYYYSRDNGRLKQSAQSSKTMEDRTLYGLSRIEDYVARYGHSPVLFDRFTWNGGLRPYLNADNTINPQWKRANGASIEIKAIKGLRIKRIKLKTVSLKR